MTGQPTDRPDWEAKVAALLAESCDFMPRDHCLSCTDGRLLVLDGIRMGLEAAAQECDASEARHDNNEAGECAVLIRALLPEEKP